MGGEGIHLVIFQWGTIFLAKKSYVCIRFFSYFDKELTYLCQYSCICDGGHFLAINRQGGGAFIFGNQLTEGDTFLAFCNMQSKAKRSKVNEALRFVICKRRSHFVCVSVITKVMNGKRRSLSPVINQP